MSFFNFNRNKVAVGYCLLTLYLVGCTTIITSEKLSPSAQGQPYCLPIQALSYEKRDNGKFEFKILENIPDNTKMYVVRATSFLSSYTFDVQKDRVNKDSGGAQESEGSGSCLLTYIGLDSKVPEAIMKSTSEAFGTFGKTAIDQVNQQNTAKKALNDAVRVKEIAVRMAKLDRDKLNSKGTATPQEISEADNAIEKAIRELNQARLAAGFVPLEETPASGFKKENQFQSPDISQIELYQPEFYTIKHSTVDIEVDIKDKYGNVIGKEKLKEPTVKLVGMKYSKEKK